MAGFGDWWVHLDIEIVKLWIDLMFNVILSHYGD